MDILEWQFSTGETCARFMKRIIVSLFLLPILCIMYGEQLFLKANSSIHFLFILSKANGKRKNLHKKALEYSFPCPITVNLKKGNSILGNENQILDIQSENVLIFRIVSVWRKNICQNV